LIILGSDVEYTFGQEAVLVPARHLVNGFAARYEPTGSTVTYTHLLLPEHETLLVAGSSFESLYIGRIRRKLQVYWLYSNELACRNMASQFFLS
jgi:hypothetical protein